MTLLKRGRMSTEERREQLLSAGVELLASRPYDEVSIEEIARAAGVSKGLLYHYFPTKRDFLIAAIERGEEELAELTAPDPDLPPAEQLGASIDRFLGFVEEHEAAYSAIFRSRGGGDPAIQAALEAGRRQRMDAVIDSLAAWEAAPANLKRSAALETAVQGWLFFVEGSVLRWLERRDLGREELRDLLALTLMAALGAAQAVESGAGTTS